MPGHSIVPISATQPPAATTDFAQFIPLIAAGIGAAGALYAGSKTRSFQREMSNTAHQRAQADLRQAGLNPILGATSPASTPTPEQRNPFQNVQVASAQRIQQKQAQADIALKGDTGAKTRAETANIIEQTARSRASAKGLTLDLQKKEAVARLYNLINKIGNKIEKMDIRSIWKAIKGDATAAQTLTNQQIQKFLLDMGFQMKTPTRWPEKQGDN